MASTSPPVPASIVPLVPLDELVRDPNQPRQTFPQGPLDELAESIWLHGLRQPVAYTPSPDGGPHVIYVGERRWRAFQQNRQRAEQLLSGDPGLPEDHPARRYGAWNYIPALEEPPLSPADRIVGQIDENDQRNDLTLYERSAAYHKALTLSGLSAKDFSAKYNIHRSLLSRYKSFASSNGLTKLALETGILLDPEATSLFQQLPYDTQESLIEQAREEEAHLTRVQLKKVLDAISAAADLKEKADAEPPEKAKDSPEEKGDPKATAAGAADAPEAGPAAPVAPPEAAAAVAPPAPAGPALLLDTLCWLENLVRDLDAGADEPLRAQAHATFEEAVLLESPLILIRESLGERGSSPAPTPTHPEMSSAG
jgi:ParB-like chromosome segregation protein Spo0J